MIQDSHQLLQVLKRHKFLRGSLLRRLQESNPVEYAFNISSGYPDSFLLSRFPLEQIIKSSYGSYLYARLVLQARFPEGEAAIAKNGVNSSLYVYNILHDRFPLAEPAIAEAGRCTSEDYCVDILKFRARSRPELENMVREWRYDQGWSGVERENGPNLI